MGVESKFPVNLVLNRPPFNIESVSLYILISLDVKLRIVINDVKYSMSHCLYNVKLL